MENLYYFMDMKPITEYEDYRLYLRDFYEERKKTSVFSWREFAKLAGFSSSGYLKLVCDGKTRLSKIGAVKVAPAMGLAGFQADYFCLMVEFCDAPDDTVRMNAYSRMRALAKENGVRILGTEAFGYFSSWVNPTVRELAPIMKGAKPSDIAKACAPAITVGEARNAIEMMVRIGLLERKPDGTYVRSLPPTRWIRSRGRTLHFGDDRGHRPQGLRAHCRGTCRISRENCGHCFGGGELRPRL